MAGQRKEGERRRRKRKKKREKRKKNNKFKKYNIIKKIVHNVNRKVGACRPKLAE